MKNIVKYYCSKINWKELQDNLENIKKINKNLGIMIRKSIYSAL